MCLIQQNGRLECIRGNRCSVNSENDEICEVEIDYEIRQFPKPKLRIVPNMTNALKVIAAIEK